MKKNKNNRGWESVDRKKGKKPKNIEIESNITPISQTNRFTLLETDFPIYYQQANYQQHKTLESVEVTSLEKTKTPEKTSPKTNEKVKPFNKETTPKKHLRKLKHLKKQLKHQ